MVMSSMHFVIIRGEPACLWQGFHLLKPGSVTKTVETIEGRQDRQFQLIEVKEYDPIRNVYTEIGPHWADAVTGSLYKTTGECLTSYQIKMVV